MDRQTKLIAFDVDGTLLDNSGLFIEAYRRLVPKFNEKTGNNIVFTEKNITGVLGLPPVEIFTGLMPGVDMKHCNLMLRMFMDELEGAVSDGGTELFDGVKPVIERLHNEGYVLAAASNGVRSYIETVLGHFGLMPMFSLPVIVVEEEIRNKNEILSSYIERINPRLTVMVGDRYTDREAAGSCGVSFIGCSFGHADISELEGERHIVSDFYQIYDMIKKIEHEQGVS